MRNPQRTQYGYKHIHIALFALQITQCSGGKSLGIPRFPALPEPVPGITPRRSVGGRGAGSTLKSREEKKLGEYRYARSRSALSALQIAQYSRRPSRFSATARRDQRVLAAGVAAGVAGLSAGLAGWSLISL